MAALISVADGSLTTAATWAVADATSLVDAETGSNTLTTTNTSSSAFTPGAITIDGFALKVNSRPGSTGTLTVALQQAAVDVSGTVVTVNVADLPVCVAVKCKTWVFFKFAAPITLAAATAYTIAARTSATSLVSLFRTGAGTDWSRMLRTTTTQAPVAGTDRLLVMGGLTGAGTNEGVRTVTIDTTSTASSYGNSAARQTQSIDVCHQGVLAAGTTASTAYQFQCYGINVFSGGELRLGSATTPVPNTSSFLLQFNNAANVDCGLECWGGVLTMWGTPPGGWTGSGATQTPAAWTHRARLTANVAAAGTSLTTDVATGWKNGDVMLLAGTDRQGVGHEERLTLGADASGTTVTTPAVTNAHTGNTTTKVQAEVATINRNVKVQGTSSTFNAYIRALETVAATTSHWRCAEFTNMGSATASKTGITLEQVVGAMNVQWRSIHDFIVAGSIGLSFTVGPSTATNVFSNNVFTVIASSCVNVASFLTSINSHSMDNNVVIKTTAVGFFLSGMDLGSFINNWVTGCTTGISCGTATATASATGDVPIVATGNVVHNNSSTGFLAGFSVGRHQTVDISNLITYRNGNIGLDFTSSNGFVKCANLWAFGNGSAFGSGNVGATQGGAGAQAFGGYLLLIDPTIGGEVTGGGLYQAAYSALQVGIRSAQTIVVENPTISSGTLGAQAHGSSDILIVGQQGVNYPFVRLIIRGGTLNGSTLLVNQTLLSAHPECGIFLEDVIVAGGSTVTRTYRSDGIISRDTVIYDTGAADAVSERLTPNNATYKLQSGRRMVAAASGQTVTITGKIRRSVVGDGTAYNGSAPRLIMERYNPLGASFLADVVAWTSSAAAGSFESFSYTTPAFAVDGVVSFFVDCDGTTGWVNVDTWAAS